MARQPEPEKRLALAWSAVSVLQREGTDVSMAALADALDVKRPTLLYHFASKADIVEAALVDLLSEQAVFVMERVGRHTHPIDRLFAHLQGVHEFHRGREARVVFLTQAIVATAGARMAEIIESGNRVFEAQRRAAVALVRQGITDGTVAPCDPEALVATTRALVDGLMVQRVVEGLDLAPVHAMLWEGLFRPLRREPPRADAPPAPRTSKKARTRR